MSAAEDELPATAICRHEGCDKRFPLARHGNRSHTSERRLKRHLFCSPKCRVAHNRRMAGLRGCVTHGGVTALKGTIPKGCVTAPKTPPFSSGKAASLEAIRPETKTEKSHQLEWQEVNSVTWRLVDPGGPQLRIEASHGQWGGYHYPKALAYVSDVGVNDRDWRVYVRQRGKWRAWGSVGDLATARRIAQDAVENPAKPKPAKFDIPLNLLGGYRHADAPMLHPQMLSHICDVEIGAVKVEAPNEPASGDDEPINVSATDDQVAVQWMDDLANAGMDETLERRRRTLVSGNFLPMEPRNV
jgi:hypothetical protein